VERLHLAACKALGVITPPPTSPHTSDAPAGDVGAGVDGRAATAAAAAAAAAAENGEGVAKQQGCCKQRSSSAQRQDKGGKPPAGAKASGGGGSRAATSRLAWLWELLQLLLCVAMFQNWGDVLFTRLPAALSSRKGVFVSACSVWLLGLMIGPSFFKAGGRVGL